MIGRLTYLCCNYIAFDMLYGPTNPQFAHEIDKADTADIFKLVFGSVGAMLGFKGADRWTTADRRYVLEKMFNDKYSHILKYLKELTIQGINFTILVQPFLDFTKVLEQPDSEKYICYITGSLIRINDIPYIIKL